MTDTVIERHLAGEIAAGMYPLLHDDRCRLLACDSMVGRERSMRWRAGEAGRRPAHVDTAGAHRLQGRGSPRRSAAHDALAELSKAIGDEEA